MTKLEKGRANSFTTSSPGEPCRVVQLSQSLGHKDLEHRFPSDKSQQPCQTHAVFPFILTKVYSAKQQAEWRDAMAWPMPEGAQDHSLACTGSGALTFQMSQMDSLMASFSFNDTEKILHSNPYANIWTDALCLSVSEPELEQKLCKRLFQSRQRRNAHAMQRSWRMSSWHRQSPADTHEKVIDLYT